MNKKNRIEIPSEIAAEILFLSDRTCCICNIKGKQVQIHHIDENPSNNNIDNLSVLCFDCHNETMIKGGFGRGLNEQQIKKYKSDWLDRVVQRKRKADELASLETITGKKHEFTKGFSFYKINDNPDLLLNYLLNILITNEIQLSIAQSKWVSGDGSVVNQATYDMIDFYEKVLIELASFFPMNHFSHKKPKDYFNELVSYKFNWYNEVLQPFGHGTGGSIVSTMTASHIMNELREMVALMVDGLMSKYNIENRISYIAWKEKWLK